MNSTKSLRSIAIACGGTGGHLFPGLAVADKLLQRGCKVTLLISPKEVDQRGVKPAAGLEIVTLPAVGLQRGARLAFFRGFSQSYRAARALFHSCRPQAVLAMGSFTSAPPILAGKMCGARTFLHESNTIPGRANRWLAWLVNGAFVGFPCAAGRLQNRRVTITGTPVRPGFKPRDAGSCRQALGLEPERPVALVTGGSQGASGLNEMVIRTLPLLAERAPGLQWFHLAGPRDVEKVRQAYAAAGLRAVVHPFFAKMELALGAANVAISRAGASSLAELAAMRVPAVLVPYPSATDNHQLHNAQAFVETGAARLLEEVCATGEVLARLMMDLIANEEVRQEMQVALARWQAPGAAAEIAETMLEAIVGPLRLNPAGLEVRTNAPLPERALV